MTDVQPPRPPMQRSYTRWWLLLLVASLAVEGVALLRRGGGDTLSEHVWKLMAGWPGVPIFALVYWLALWHLPWGAGRRLSWLDLAAAGVGVAVWWFARDGRP